MGSLNSVGWLGMRLRFVSDSVPRLCVWLQGNRNWMSAQGNSESLVVRLSPSISPGTRPGRITKRNHGRGKAVSATKHLPVTITFGPQRAVNAGDVN